MSRKRRSAPTSHSRACLFFRFFFRSFDNFRLIGPIFGHLYDGIRFDGKIFFLTILQRWLSHLPPLGVIDITPIVAYFGLVLVEWLVMSVLLAGFA